METSKVKELIIAGLTDPHVEVADTTGTGDHFSAVIISDDFNDLSLIISTSWFINHWVIT